MSVTIVFVTIGRCIFTLQQVPSWIGKSNARQFVYSSLLQFNYCSQLCKYQLRSRSSYSLGCPAQLASPIINQDNKTICYLHNYTTGQNHFSSFLVGKRDLNHSHTQHTCTHKTIVLISTIIIMLSKDLYMSFTFHMSQQSSSDLSHKLTLDLLFLNTFYLCLSQVWTVFCSKSAMVFAFHVHQINSLLTPS